MHSSSETGRVPRVSVVIPTRDRAQLLSRAIASVLAQTCDDFELIVVDDASRDRTSEVVAGFRDARISCIRLACAGGAPRARNLGIAACRAPLVAFLDDDDEWLPQKLERQLQYLDAAPPELALVYCGTDLVAGPSGRIVHSIRPADHRFSATDFLREIPFTTSNVLVRRDCLQAVGAFDVTLSGAQDRDLWIRIARCHEVGGVPDVLVRRYVHGNQISSCIDSKIRAKRQMLEKHREDYARLPRERAHQLWRLGVLCCIAGRTSEGRAALGRAVALRPLQRQPWADLLLAWLASPARCAESLLARRVNRIDGIPVYY